MQKRVVDKFGVFLLVKVAPAILLCLMSILLLVQDARAFDRTRTIVVDGRKRRYIVHQPRQHRDGPLPVVLLLHGAGSHPRLTAWVSGLSKEADKDGFYAVYPGGTPSFLGLFRTWNAGTCCGAAKRREVDDVAFISALIGKLKENYRIDPARVYVAGMSNGAMMAYRIARELSDQVAAVASVEGCLMDCEDGGQKDPVSVIAFHGVRDRVVPIDGSQGIFLHYRIKYHFLPDEQSIQYFVRNNHCQPEPVLVHHEGVVEKRWLHGKNNTEVVFFRIGDGGHFWPGAGRFFRLLGSSKQISATKRMLEFFRSHPKQPESPSSPAPRESACASRERN